MRCQGCPDRYVGCHSTCEYYIEFAKERERLRHKRQLDNEAASVAARNILRRQENYRRKKNG